MFVQRCLDSAFVTVLMSLVTVFALVGVSNMSSVGRHPPDRDDQSSRHLLLLFAADFLHPLQSWNFNNHHCARRLQVLFLFLSGHYRYSVPHQRHSLDAQLTCFCYWAESRLRGGECYPWRDVHWQRCLRQDHLSLEVAETYPTHSYNKTLQVLLEDPKRKRQEGRRQPNSFQKAQGRAFRRSASCACRDRIIIQKGNWSF